ncbi:ABC transporter permease [Thiomicrorhabdus sp. Milos-T2]|uniref:ABC transporter permease n=1 Tax=Thiomicrorhabdus sp. Milos-T2 TaxID=90814 RepID=UPI000ABD8DED|nr:ABC transporter permease [Thiomicrorhabdus sp. Milos-T2]
MMNLQTVLTITKKEMLEIWRDRVYFIMAFVFPFIMILILGFGLSFDVEKMPFAVLDYDNSDQSRDYSYKFISSRYFDYKGSIDSVKKADELINTSKVRFVLVIPPEFSKNIINGYSAEVQAQIDGMFNYRASVVSGYISAINANYNSELIQQWAMKSQGMTSQAISDLISPVSLETRYLYNNELKSIWSTGTGLIVLVMLVSPAMLAALGVVREKETGSIFNIYASTASRSEFITGKLLPYIAISYINISILCLLALWVFQAPFKGDLSVLLVANFFFVASAAAIGVLISSFVKSQAAAALISMLGTMIPGIMYSGLMMPVASMSSEAVIEAHAFPAMYQLEVIWGVFLKGQGWPELWLNILILSGFLILLWLLAVLRFRKRVNG